MQFIDIKKQYAVLQPDIQHRIGKVFAHGKFINGPEVQELETRLAAFAGVNHALACSSGTDALVMALMAWGIGSGDAVFVPAFTFVATAEAAVLAGATPVFVDIRPDTFHIDPERLAQAVKATAETGALTPKAVVPVDLFGLPADYDEIAAVAREYGLKVLEDAAQGFGGKYRGRTAGSLGDAAATSFFPAKPLGCYGDGGAVFTDDDETAAVLRSVREHGQGADRYENVRTGINGRLDTLQAAVLLVKLGVFNEEIRKRNRIAAKYNKALSGLVQTPAFTDGRVSTWAQYSVLARDGAQREAILRALSENGVPTAIYYRKPLHLQRAYAKLGYGPGDMPVSEAVSERIFSLPMHPYITDEDVARIADTVSSCMD